MITRSGVGVGEASLEPLLEELLAEVVTGIRSEPKEGDGERVTAALAEAAMVSFSRTVSHASAVERVLLVDALSPALAEALAPALAKALAPEIVTALSHLAATPEPARKENARKEEGITQSHESSKPVEESNPVDESKPDQGSKPEQQVESGEKSGEEPSKPGEESKVGTGGQDFSSSSSSSSKGKRSRE